MDASGGSQSVVEDSDRQKRSSALVITESVEIQETTEGECQPFFVDLSTLRKHSQDHLRDTGLLPSEEDGHNLDVCLLREKHYEYLSRVFLPSRQPLNGNLVSLDSSRPWMMYWTLHGSDLLLVSSQEEEDNNHTTGTATADGASTTCTNLLCQKVGENALTAVVSTMEACWQSIEITLPQHLDLTDQDRTLLEPNNKTNNNGNNPQSFQGGGFGGGPGQMAHAATTYAAILTLCIVATSEGQSSSPMAWSLLARIRKPLYAWFLSLQQSHGGFRMHHDGEIDVRASYTIFCIAKLLNLLTPTLASNNTVDFIASCQTYEGGFGGEPFTEAHGGYAYCAVAALQLVNRLEKIDREALTGWLCRRQLGYEGGFSGRANKLVDGCYSFWQGGALAIVSAHYAAAAVVVEDEMDDLWLTSPPLSYALLFDKPMLQRYILLCAQDVNGGLRDKPSKKRDFYHSCYNLSGLAMTQHSGDDGNKAVDTNNQQQTNFGHPVKSLVATSHPCYNIRLERVSKVLEYFKS
ncbi:farnesyltransferase subunit beta [Seminavis robusta]|uniref:Protein farnesyltransferase subunit beta n=1 Tax=Seminavis robusta TaxID=568900 RepID=A0A9N8DKL3_9STRA|nr:farnesyltransferase subunit beta [Seminavis robusta]|eukprot:Sro132_g062510.1 farnesyltransferase subunit beta (521) ;mRNA; f:35792-37445